MSLFGELGRRNVFRVSIAYAIIAWLVVQVADIVFETIGAPEWVMQTLMLGLVLGFFVALLFSWAYEVTPEGVKREAEVDRSASITGVTGRKLDRVIMGLLVVALVYFVWESRIAGPELVPVAETIPQPVEETATPISDLSIAVLPFENRSTLAEDQFFVDGMHDDLLTTLAKIGSMKVISRTSVMEYRDGSKKIPQIAEELGVANVLEGGVQRSGSKVRINMQLIDADTDEHLWAEIYDRELTAENLFAIQSEISNAIASALHATLSPEEQESIDRAPTDNLEAFDHYLRGRQLMATREVAKLELATEEFLTAVEIDPNFALAWVAVADSHSLLENYNNLPNGSFREIRDHAIERALQIDDRLGEAYASLGAVYADNNRPEEAERAYEQAIEYNPNYATAYHWLSNVLRWDILRAADARRNAQRAAELDPRSGIILTNLAGAHNRIGDYQAASRQARQLVEMHPDFAQSHRSMATAYLNAGDFTKNIDALWKASEIDSENLGVMMSLAYGYATIGARDELDRVIDEMHKRWPESSFAQVMELTAVAPFGTHPDTREVLEDVLAADPDIYLAWDVGVAALYAGELDLALSGFALSFTGDPREVALSSQYVAENTGIACNMAWILLETPGYEERGQELLGTALEFYENGMPDEILHQDRWAWDLCYLIADNNESALQLIEQQLAHNHTWNWPWDHLLQPYSAIREHPRYVAARTEFERRMARQLEDLRAKDKTKPAFEF